MKSLALVGWSPTGTFFDLEVLDLSSFSHLDAGGVTPVVSALAEGRCPQLRQLVIPLRRGGRE